MTFNNGKTNNQTLISDADREIQTRGSTAKYLPHDVAVNKWITSCHKNRMTTRVITFWCVYVMSLTTFVSTTRFIKIFLFMKAIGGGRVARWC